MFDHLPEFVDPLVMAEKHRRFSGKFPLDRMSRLADALLSTEGDVVFDLSFDKQGRYVTVTGRVEARLQLTCQCCLRGITLDVDDAVSLAVVRSIDEANRLPEQYEALMLQGETVSLAEVVEDELLLAIPAVPQHASCDATSSKTAEPRRGGEPRENPFAVLAELKKNIYSSE